MDIKCKRVGKRQMYRRAAAAVQNEVKSLYYTSETANSSSFEEYSHYTLPRNDVSYENNCATNESSFEGCNDCSLPFNDISDENYIQTFANDFKDERYSSCSSECVDDTETSESLSCQLKNWILTHNIPRVAVTSLLHVLCPYHPELPLDYRTFLQTPMAIKTKKLDNGEYAHIGFSDALQHFLSITSLSENTIFLSFNIDGIPLFKSTQTSLWPILATITNVNSSPFVIGIFCGGSKPSPLSLYLEDFLNEISILMENGFLFNHTMYKIKIHSFICDAPARAYLKCTKGHNGYSCCDKCEIRGKHFPGRMVLSNTTAPVRTDSSFLLQTDKEHHLAISPLTKLSVGLVTCFPIDYMHCVCLGVMRKLLNTWTEGPRSLTKLSNNSIRNISDHLLSLRKYIPIEFNRKPRNLSELPRWKATEFRLFLLYLGPLVLKNAMNKTMFKNFLLFHCAISVLISAKHLKNLGSEIAEELLTAFVQHCKNLYGEEFVIYNVHILIHLKHDVEHYGPLDNFSAFPYENFLNRLKKLVRSPTQPLQQICKRLKEINFFGKLKVSSLNSEYTCFMEHNNGPLSSWREIRCKQFKKVILHLQNFVLCTVSHSQADAYCMLQDNNVVQVCNILRTSGNDVFLICRPFLCYSSYYNYPIESSKLFIYIVKNLSLELKITRISNVIAKCILLPLNGNECFVSFPLLHSLSH